MSPDFACCWVEVSCSHPCLTSVKTDIHGEEPQNVLTSLLMGRSMFYWEPSILLTLIKSNLGENPLALCSSHTV